MTAQALELETEVQTLEGRYRAACAELAELRQRPMAIRAEIDSTGKKMGRGEIDAPTAQNDVVNFLAELNLLPYSAAAAARRVAMSRMQMLFAAKKRLEEELQPLCLAATDTGEHGQAVCDVFSALTGQLKGIFADPAHWPPGIARRDEIRRIVSEAECIARRVSQLQFERQDASRELQETWQRGSASEIDNCADRYAQKVRAEIAADCKPV